MSRFRDIGVVSNLQYCDNARLGLFLESVEAMRSSGKWNKAGIVRIFKKLLPDFSHNDLGKYLDEKM